MNKDEAKRDRELGMHRAITRRDFLNGIAVGAGSTLASTWLPGYTLAAETAHFAQDGPGYNPAALTGMRGSHPGAFEVAHALRDGKFWETAGKPVDTHETYDLIVVGAGMSGLAAAYFYRKQAGSSARILILITTTSAAMPSATNFARAAVCCSPTAGPSSPFPYSEEARGLLTELGIDPPALEKKCMDRNLSRPAATQAARVH